MKISRLAKYKTKLIKLKLLTAKNYKNQKDFDYSLLKNTETQLKKILHIIYRFHIANKKILFIGTPLHLNSQIKELVRKEQHNFIPEKIWMNGIITNSGPSFKHLLKRHAINADKALKFLFDLKNPTDLIVVLNEQLNLAALKESSLRQVPTISFNSNYHSSTTHLSTYKMTGSYNFSEKEMKNNLFFLLLSSLFKKAKTLKKKKFQTQKKIKNLKRKQKMWTQNHYKYNFK